LSFKGVEFRIKSIKINDTDIKLQIWDTGYYTLFIIHILAG